ncbi:MAG: hypothetical protein QM737_20380 [Ferruginibacter sp.]
MNKPIIYLWSLIAIIILYLAFTFLLFLRLKFKLRNADLEMCKKQLGPNYKYRQDTKGLTKYKWVLGLMIVRGCFDETGKLIECEIKPYRFFPLFYKRSFS